MKRKAATHQEEKSSFELRLRASEAEQNRLTQQLAAQRACFERDLRQPVSPVARVDVGRRVQDQEIVGKLQINGIDPSRHIALPTSRGPWDESGTQRRSVGAGVGSPPPPFAPGLSTSWRGTPRPPTIQSSVGHAAQSPVRSIGPGSPHSPYSPPVPAFTPTSPTRQSASQLSPQAGASFVTSPRRPANQLSVRLAQPSAGGAPALPVSANCASTPHLVNPVRSHERLPGGFSSVPLAYAQGVWRP